MSTLKSQVHALRTLIEYRERVGPRVYIANDLDSELRAALRSMERLLPPPAEKGS